MICQEPSILPGSELSPRFWFQFRYHYSVPGWILLFSIQNCKNIIFGTIENIRNIIKTMEFVDQYYKQLLPKQTLIPTESRPNLSKLQINRRSVNT